MADTSQKESISNQLVSGFLKPVKALAIILLLLLVVFLTFGTIVPPGSIGVRPTYFGPGKGFNDTALPTGLHLVIPYYTKVHILPGTVKILDLSVEDGTGLKNLKTSDGALVDVDLTILYSLYNNADKTSSDIPHGGPTDLVTNLSLSTTNWEKQIISATEKALRENLPKLSASSFYDPDQRIDLTENALKEMRVALAGFGIKIDDILLRRYTYQSKRIDDAIFQKNLQDQEVRLNDTRSKFSAAQAKLEQVAAEWDAKIRTLLIKGENEAEVLKSEASLMESELKASADVKMAKAIAEVDRLKANILANTQGADVYVAKESVGILSSLSGGIVTGIDPLDLDSLSAKLGVSGSQSNSSQANNSQGGSK